MFPKAMITVRYAGRFQPSGSSFTTTGSSTHKEFTDTQEPIPKRATRTCVSSERPLTSIFSALLCDWPGMRRSCSVIGCSSVQLSSSFSDQKLSARQPSVQCRSRLLLHSLIDLSRRSLPLSSRAQHVVLARHVTAARQLVGCCGTSGVFLSSEMASLSAGGRRTDNPSRRTGRRRRRPQLPAEVFYVHHTDKDVMFLFPTDPEETVVKRVRNGVCASPPTTPDHCWGSLMPPEILHNIFQFVVNSDGAVPALCRLAQMCRLWRRVAYSPDLWRRVSLSYCWAIPGIKTSPTRNSMIKKTIEDLMQNRLSQVSDFSLHHWSHHVTLVLQNLASCCPLLTTLTLSHCKKVTASALVSVGDHCQLLTSLNLQDTEVDSKAVPLFLGVRGSSLRCLFLSVNCQTSNILKLLASGSCPELRVLEVNRGMGKVQVWPEGLQASCPKLEVLRLLNLVFKLRSRCASEGPGFSHLQELCLATSKYSEIEDTDIKRLLRHCSNLRVLDLRGCYRVTAEGLSDLPCTDLENLYLGNYSFTSGGEQFPTGCCFITRRWRHSLRELELNGLRISQSELGEALRILAGDWTNNVLQSLILSGTKVSGATVRDFLSSCPALTHLDLSSCRNVPRGLKVVYRGRESILQCLEALSNRMQEDVLE